MTVQAPQLARSQTRFAPVNSNSLRSVSSSVVRGSTSAAYFFELMFSEIGTFPGPYTFTSAPAMRIVREPITSGTESETPETLRKSRREKPASSLSRSSPRFLFSSSFMSQFSVQGAPAKIRDQSELQLLRFRQDTA